MKINIPIIKKDVEPWESDVFPVITEENRKVMEGFPFGKFVCYGTVEKPTYTIGVDTYDKDIHSYCLGRKVNGVFEILIAKTLSKEEFEHEVQTLAKCFDADVISNNIK